MSLAADVAAVRNGVTLAPGDHIACVRITGAGGHELLDRVSPRELFVRTGQMLHTLLLDDSAKPIADVYICCDEDDYLVVAEGLSGPALATCLRGHAIDLPVTVSDLGASHGFVCLDGPYAWEVLAEVASPDVIGLPYLSFFHEGRFTCFRGGKTGEYGYDLMIERERIAEVRELFTRAGKRFELREIGLPALELCSLEAGFFNVRREVRAGLTPIELQLQWRVTAGRKFPGSETLTARRRDAKSRIALVASEGDLATDAAIDLEGQRVGTILHAGRSFTRDEWLGVALLDRQLSYAGLGGFASGGAPVRTVSAPAINNRSLYVDPQRHSFATRDSAKFPPLLRPRWS